MRLSSDWLYIPTLLAIFCIIVATVAILGGYVDLSHK